MKVFKSFAQWFIQPIIRNRIHRADIYEYKGIVLHIPAGVFHPKYFFSTKYLLKTVLALPIKNKTLLELGAGSGLISLTAAKEGAIVTASDISKTVITTLEQNAHSCNINIEIIHSDLFTAIPDKQFNFIIINPPYYPKEPRNELEMAWYCGKDFEYYHKLFAQLPSRIYGGTLVLMILADGCDITTIKEIALSRQLQMNIYTQQKIWWEQQYIFKITKL